jgi:hypothetical protein
LLPHAVQRAHCRSLSLDVSAPQRITGTAHASGSAIARVTMDKNGLRY